MKNNRDTGRFLVWFCDKVYGVARLFDATMEEGRFERKLPEIAAGVAEIRCVEPRIRAAYGKLQGIDKRLAHLDEALLEVERLALAGHITEAGKEECRAQLYCCARELASIWMRLRGAETSKGVQTRLGVGIQKVPSLPTISRDYKIYHSHNKVW